MGKPSDLHQGFPTVPVTGSPLLSVPVTSTSAGTYALFLPPLSHEMERKGLAAEDYGKIWCFCAHESPPRKGWSRPMTLTPLPGQ